MDPEVRQAGALLMLLMEEKEELKIKGHLHHSNLAYADRPCLAPRPAVILCPWFYLCQLMAPLSTAHIQNGHCLKSLRRRLGGLGTHCQTLAAKMGTRTYRLQGTHSVAARQAGGVVLVSWMSRIRLGEPNISPMARTGAWTQTVPVSHMVSGLPGPLGSMLGIWNLWENVGL